MWFGGDEALEMKILNNEYCANKRIKISSVLQEQRVGCYVRNDPKVPVQRILRTLLRMKMSGEIDDIIRLYIGKP